MLYHCGYKAGGGCGATVLYLKAFEPRHNSKQRDRHTTLCLGGTVTAGRMCSNALPGQMDLMEHVIVTSFPWCKQSDHVFREN